MRKRRLPIPWFAFAGLGVILLTHGGALLGVDFVRTWFTPLVWWGTILFVDGLVYRLSGSSFLTRRRAEFLLLLPASVLSWLFFEFCNVYLEVWHYIGVPNPLWLRYLGYAIAFATILPAIFVTAELLQATPLFAALRGHRVVARPPVRRGSIVIGAALILVPLAFPEPALIPLIWVGVFLFLDPINYRCGGRSILRLLEKGRADSVLSLVAAGGVCGLLWEFWNAQAGAKWYYTFPYTETIRYFEMPVLGLLGFLPFALECYAMASTFLVWVGREGHARFRDVALTAGFFIVCLALPLTLHRETRPFFPPRPAPESVSAAAAADTGPAVARLAGLLSTGRLEDQLDAARRLAALDRPEAMKALGRHLKHESPVMREELTLIFREYSRRHRFREQ